jgi:hypothetical protein
VPGNNAYPLTKVDQAMVPKKLTTSPKDLRIRAFLDYAVGPLQQNLPAGYVPLPTSLQLQTLHYTGDPLQTTTTPSTTTTTLPAPDFSQGSSVGSSDYTPSYTAPTPTTPPTAAPPTTRPTTTTKSPTTTTTPPRTAKLVALRLPDSGDHLVLPIATGLALLAILAASVDEVRRHGRQLWRRVRKGTPATDLDPRSTS